MSAYSRWIVVLFVIALPAAGGFLAFLQVVRSSDAGVSGLSAPVALALSHDGRHLYAAGRDDNALVVFALDAITGELSFVDAYVDGENGLFGLLAPSGVAVSPDDRHVYVTSQQDDALVVFARDATLDTLTFVEIELDGMAGADGLDGAADVAVTSDDELVLVAGYDDGALAIFRRDATSDDLAFVEAELGIAGARSVAISPDSGYAYVAAALGASVEAYARDATGDAFAFVASTTGAALGGLSELEMTPDGANLYAAAYDDDAVTAFTRDAGGGLTLLGTHVDGAGGVDGLDGASSIAVRDSLDLAFVAGQLEDSIAVFNRDPADGTLYFAQALVNGASGIEGLDGPSSVVASADGRYLYAAAEIEGAVVVLRVDAYDFGDAPSPYPTQLADDGARHDYVSGAPSLGQAPDAEADGQPSAGADADDLTALADEDGVVFLHSLIPGEWARAQVTVTGASQLDAWIDFGGDGGWSEAGDQIFADKTLAAGVSSPALLVPDTATPGTSTVARFRISTAGGLDATGSAIDGEVEDHAVDIEAAVASTDGAFLDFRQSVRASDLEGPGLGGPVALAASPDGRHLYAVGGDDDALVVFIRDTATGYLTYVDAYVHDTGGIFGLSGASSVAVSPDGRHVYVTGADSDALAVFARDAVLDTLTFVAIETQEDGVSGVDGLDGATSVAVSPDDELVVVASSGDNALAVFQRDPVDDSLTFVEARFLAGDGITGASSVALSPDSGVAYVAGATSAGVGVYARDGSDSFSLVEAELSTDLDGVIDLDVPADGLSLYAAAFDDNQVTAFSRNADGSLEAAGGVGTISGASSIVVREQLDLAFAAGRNEDSIAVLNRDPADGALYLSQKLRDGDFDIEDLNGPRALAVAPGGGFLYAAAEHDDAVVVFRIDAFDYGDAPSPYPTLLTDDGARHDYVPGAPFLGSTPDADPDGQPSTLATGDDLTALADEDGVVFLDPLIPGESVGVGVTVSAAAQLDAWIDFDDDGGWSEAGDQIFDDETLTAGVNSLSFSVPAAAPTSVTTVARFRVSTAGGLDVTGPAGDGEVEDYAVVLEPADVPASGALLAFRQVVRASDLGVPGLGGAAALAASPDGRHLYAVARDDDALAVFTRDAAGGRLSFVDAYVDGVGGVFGLDAAGSVAVSPDGRHVYVTAASDDVLAVFARDAVQDTLTFIPAALEEDGVSGVDGLDGAASVAVTPDDELVLVASSDDNALAVFRRDPTGDDLTFVEARFLAADGLGGASAVAIDPDSDFAYVAGATSAGIGVYARDPSDSYSLVEIELNTDLDGVAGLEIPADGLNLYAAAPDDDTVTVFTRNADGSLTFPAAFLGASSVGGIAGAASVAVRQQLDLAFVAGRDEDSVAVLNRDPGDGTLYLAQTLTNGSLGISGLDGPRAVVASPDGKFLYAAAESENAIVVLRVDAFDYGDAPSPYPTELAGDGARHDYVPGAPFLGSAPDAEPDGQASAGATGDDAAAIGDEDGITFLDPLEPGAAVDVMVTITATGRLDAWIDFNADGGWSEAGDQIFDDVSLAAGSHTLTFTVPVTATPNVSTVARFRVSTAGDLDATGSADDGEVEDHAIVTVPVELTAFGVE